MVALGPEFLAVLMPGYHPVLLPEASSLPFIGIGKPIWDAHLPLILKSLTSHEEVLLGVLASEG